jgi:hypothetical protein
MTKHEWTDRQDRKMCGQDFLLLTLALCESLQINVPTPLGHSDERGKKTVDESIFPFPFILHYLIVADLSFL